MSKTKADVKKDLNDVVNGSKSFTDMINHIADYIAENFSWKKITVTTKTVVKKPIISPVKRPSKPIKPNRSK
jgi:hypothetical protein